ncbi:hypothetical protein EPA93_28285 [Ktedonosporobacter rubrisoli]|uniref:Uncharacterized protein n=1 Tax=Ktedonosporobacter rubrisoli TaxID=2509675 RepID=A0A4P6JXB9_KTERU|nr:hypothetical protein [Ktedonosporobacter rubrisoli]QBD79666.1 hypothetical protein EPA93_28285 [Ktedonosporobacter rubrisoli]
MGMNMGIYDQLQRMKNNNQPAPQEVQQAIANNDTPEKLTQAQKLAKDGQLTIGQAAQTAQDAQRWAQQAVDSFGISYFRP